MSSLKLQKLRINVKAYESTILDNACTKIVDAVKESGIEPNAKVDMGRYLHFHKY